MMFVLLILLGYVCGSIATSVWISKGVYGKDIRTQGSGNAGATNVYRVLGWKPALVVVFVDIGKGALPTALVPYLFDIPSPDQLVWLQILTGFSAVAGHCWTIFAGFRGGKGVATGAGMLLVLYPIAVPVCILVFALVVWRTKMVGLASICAATALPLTMIIHMFFLGGTSSLPLLILGGSLLPFVLYTHRANIARMINGTENKIA